MSELLRDMRDFAGGWVGFTMAFVLPLVATVCSLTSVALTLSSR